MPLDAYGEKEYWDWRYGGRTGRFDWYHQYWALKPVLDKVARRSEPVLHVGVGSSTLQDDMAEDGYGSILNVDYSTVAIAQLESLRATQSDACRRACTYQVADVRCMPELRDGSFTTIVDKGLLDSILCGGNSWTNATAMIKECSRVLKPDGGAFVIFSFGDPSNRMKFLDLPCHGWDVSVYVISKLAHGGDGGGGGKDHKTDSVYTSGPFEDPCALAALETFEHLIFVYICVKRGQAEGVRADVPPCECYS